MILPTLADVPDRMQCPARATRRAGSVVVAELACSLPSPHPRQSHNFVPMPARAAGSTPAVPATPDPTMPSSVDPLLAVTIGGTGGVVTVVANLPPALRIALGL